MKKQLFLFALLIAVALLQSSCSQDEPNAPASDKDKTEGPILKIGDHEYVDLGLPSGIKWATCNIGADTPGQYGDYFNWGGIISNPEYNGSYNLPQISDISGNPDYDAARAKWGKTWRTPRTQEIRELINSCNWVWTKLEGVKGFKVTGPNGKSIFLPAAGHLNNHEKYDNGSYLSSISSLDMYGFYGLSFSMDEIDRKNRIEISLFVWSGTGRIRPVSD